MGLFRDPLLLDAKAWQCRVPRQFKPCVLVSTLVP
jgi:hypothetical protein